MYRLSTLNAFMFSVYRVEHALQRIAICMRRVIRALGSRAAVGAILSKNAFLAWESVQTRKSANRGFTMAALLLVG